MPDIVHVVGKPNELFTRLKPEPGFHFLPVEYTDKFQDYYTPGELTSADYPNLIAQGQSMPTISVQALLAVYNWPRDTDRYRRCVRFVEYLFERFDKLRVAALSAGVEADEPGRHHSRLDALPAGAGDARQDRGAARRSIPSLARTQAARAAPNNPAEQERLFQQFLEWSKQQSRR